MNVIISRIYQKIGVKISLVNINMIDQNKNTDLISVCPECKCHLLIDNGQHELVCSACGTVIDDQYDGFYVNQPTFSKSNGSILGNSVEKLTSIGNVTERKKNPKFEKLNNFNNHTLDYKDSRKNKAEIVFKNIQEMLQVNVNPTFFSHIYSKYYPVIPKSKIKNLDIFAVLSCIHICRQTDIRINIKNTLNMFNISGRDYINFQKYVGLIQKTPNNIAKEELGLIQSAIMKMNLENNQELFEECRLILQTNKCLGAHSINRSITVLVLAMAKFGLIDKYNPYKISRFFDKSASNIYTNSILSAIYQIAAENHLDSIKIKLFIAQNKITNIANLYKNLASICESCKFDTIAPVIKKVKDDITQSSPIVNIIQIKTPKTKLSENNKPKLQIKLIHPSIISDPIDSANHVVSNSNLSFHNTIFEKCQCNGITSSVSSIENSSNKNIKFTYFSIPIAKVSRLKQMRNRYQVNITELINHRSLNKVTEFLSKSSNTRPKFKELSIHVEKEFYKSSHTLIGSKTKTDLPLEKLLSFFKKKCT